MTKIRVTRILPITIIIILIIGLFYWPTLRWLFNSWLSSEYYNQGFLVPFVSLFFFWTERKQLQSDRSLTVAIPLLITSILLYALSFVWDIRFISALSLLIMITAAVFYFFGNKGARKLLFPLCFLLFMVPFPFVPNLAFKLQQLSLLSSSHLLTLLGFPITTSGAEIFLAKSAFTVGIPCSGINSLVALLALGAVYAFILEGNIFERFGLFIVTLPLAIAGNILRITSVILVAYYVDVATATGWFHTLASPVFFIIEFFILLFIGWAMRLKINYQALGMK